MTNAANVPADLKEVKAIAAGFTFSVALKQDGTVVAWGGDEYGIPKIPAGLRDVIAIAAGYNHAMALRRDGTVMTWGGDCAVVDQNYPLGLTNVVAIATSGDSPVALKRDGLVVVWGGQSTVDPSVNGVIALGKYGGVALGDPYPYGRPAAATPQITNGFLVGLNLVDGGLDYAGPPEVQIVGGGGSGAVVTATIQYGVVTGFNILGAGSGYTSPPAVVIAPPMFDQCAASPRVVNGFIIGIDVGRPGYGYTSPPRVQIVGGNGSGATAAAIVSDGKVTGFKMISAGSGYIWDYPDVIPYVIVDPPFTSHPTLNSETVRMRATASVNIGSVYQFLTSIDLKSWMPSGPPVTAQSNSISQDFDFTGAAQFFKTQQLP